ncbi:Ferritin-like domain containing protein [Lactarius tabidus]
MRLSIASLLAVAVAPIAVSAAPFRRANGTSDPTEAVILLAELLERLESTYYQEVLSKFTPDDYTAAGFARSSIPIQELTAIAFDEKTHDNLLEEFLSAADLAPLTCNFDFSKVLTSVSTAISAGRAIEYVGTSAYLGSLASINDSDVLTIGASIMTNEARHQSIMNVLNGNTAIPQAFDMAMLPNEVVTIAQAFFGDVCDTGITPNVAIDILNFGPITTGSPLLLAAPPIENLNSTEISFSCQILVGNLDVATVLPLSECIVPKDINGPALVWVTSDDKPLDPTLEVRATQQVVAGPQIIFVDSQIEALGQLVHNNSSSGSSS